MRKLTIVLVFAWLASGCVSTGDRYQVTVNSISGDHDGLSHAFLYCSNQNDSEIQKQEYQKYLKTMLEDIGYTIVQDIKESNIVIIFNYGLSSKDVVSSKSVYKYVPSKSYSYSGTTYAPMSGSMYNSSGTIQENGFGSMEYAGSQVYTETLNTRHLSVSGRKTSEFILKDKVSVPPAVWETTAVSSGSSNDMRRLFPVLTYAMRSYVGGDTKGNISVTFSVGDEKMTEFLRKSNGPEMRAPTSTHP